jgi:hypothetical protein
MPGHDRFRKVAFMIVVTLVMSLPGGSLEANLLGKVVWWPGAGVLAFVHEGPGLHRDLHGQLSHRKAEPRRRRSSPSADLARLVEASPA